MMSGLPTFLPALRTGICLSNFKKNLGFVAQKEWLCICVGYIMSCSAIWMHACYACHSKAYLASPSTSASAFAIIEYNSLNTHRQDCNASVLSLQHPGWNCILQPDRFPIGQLSPNTPFPLVATHSTSLGLSGALKEDVASCRRPLTVFPCTCGHH